jgi:hypothetical protein
MLIRFHQAWPWQHLDDYCHPFDGLSLAFPFPVNPTHWRSVQAPQ